MHYSYFFSNIAINNSKKMAKEWKVCACRSYQCAQELSRKMFVIISMENVFTK